jgi:hypothetical protein
MHPERVQQKGVVMSIYSQIFIHNLFHPFRVTISVGMCFLLSYSQLRRDYIRTFMKFFLLSYSQFRCDFYSAFHSEGVDSLIEKGNKTKICTLKGVQQKGGI